MGASMTTPVMAYLTMKGGVGKTTLAANITRALADNKKRKILLIDADAQCNLSQIFMESDQIEAAGARSINQAFDTKGRLLDPSDLKQTIYPIAANGYSEHGSTIDFIGGSFDTFELNATALPSRQALAAERFKTFIDAAKRQYDLVVIDTNPSATFVTMQALANSNFLVAPITFDAFSLQGIHLVIHHLKSKFDWLSNRDRLCLVANKVPRSPSEGESRRLEREEEKIKEKYPYLARCIKLERIHASTMLANRTIGRGFIADNNGSADGIYAKIVADFTAVGNAINLDLENAFTPTQTQNAANSERTSWSALKSYFGVPAPRA
jgi:chromosome partitioning protein